MSDPSRRLTAVCITSGLPDAVMADISQAFEASFVVAGGPVQDLPPGTELALVTAGVKFGEAELAARPASLKAIATYSSGLDHLDLAAAARRGIAVFNTPEVLGDSVADAAMLLMLGAARRATESIELIRSRGWSGWNALQLNGFELSGKTLGILGMGGIGRRVAQRARAFGMGLAYSNRRPAAPEIAGDAVYYADGGAMLGEIDVLLLAAPSTPETRGWLDAGRLAARPGLIVVNVARGELVRDDDLIAALESGRVWAAGLDVFNGEPNLDPRYFDLPNVFMLPHIGSSTVEARRRMGQVLIDAVAAWREGRRPDNQVA